MKELKTTSIKLEKRHANWIDNKGRKFNFSEWIREKIDEEIMAGR